MLSVQECVDFCGLSEDEIQVIAEHEHLTQIVAAEMGSDLLRSSEGLYRLRRYMLDNLERATQRGQFDKASRLASLFREFEGAHPELRPPR